MQTDSGKMSGLLGFYTASVLAFFAATAVAYAPPATNRTTVNFNGGWLYYKGNVSGAQATAFGDASWQAVVVPHSTSWPTPDSDAEYYGISWYRKHFTPDYTGRKVFIQFEAVMQSATVWVNGDSVGAHQGGYMGFSFDITNFLKADTDNVIAVEVNDTANANWAPGKKAVDFRYYGGIYRDVRLQVIDSLHVTDPIYANKVAGGGIFVTYPSVSTASATVSIQTDVINQSTESRSVTVTSNIVDSNGAVAATASSTVTLNAGVDSSVTQSVAIVSPRLWSHLTPNLYTLYTIVQNGATPVDYVETRIGIRTIQWTRTTGLYINGVSYKLRGCDEHQAIFGLGNAIPRKAIYYEVKSIKDAGFDFVRCCHYPHNPAFYDACDSVGILVMNSQTGWQNYSTATAFVNFTWNECRQMIRRDRNHPSVVVWETSLNESQYPTTWAESTQVHAHAEYPGNQIYTDGWLYTYFDVFSDAAAHTALYDDATSRAVICSEYGDWEYGANSSTSRVQRQGTDQALLQQAWNHYNRMHLDRTYSWFSVDALWAYADNGSNYLAGVNGTANGVFYGGIRDMYGLRKYSWYFFQSQRDANQIIPVPGVVSGPMVYIANRWQSTSPDTVKVFSNCDSVALYLNGTLVAIQGPDADTNSKYVGHPPFTFKPGKFTAGQLTADGLIGGVVKATCSRTTPGTAKTVTLQPISTDPLDTMIGNDARLVWISVVDSNGMVVPAATNVVSLTITGPGVILGPTSVAMKGGQLATWVIPGGSDGRVVLYASASGLAPDSAVLRSGALTSILPAVRKYGAGAAAAVSFRAIGQRIVLPASMNGSIKSVSVFDISGRLLWRGLTGNQVVTLAKGIGGVRTVCIVKAQVVK
jgi:hypothetical protein